MERIDDCLRRVIRRHQTSRSSSGIVYLASAPAGGVQDSLGGLGTPVFVATIMLIYLPVFLPFLLSLSLLLPLFLSSVNHGSRLHRRRQFARHTKRVDNLKGKSSLLTQEGHGTTNARASCSVEHNTSRWTRRALRYRFRSVGGAQHYHMDPRPPDPRSFGLTSHFLAHRCRSPSLLHPPVFVLLLIPECFWDLLIGNINRMHDNLG